MSIDKKDIVILRKIGEGTYGIASTATYQGLPVIVKKSKTAKIKPDVCKEILLLKYLNGRGTVQYYGSYLDGASPCIVIEQFGQSIQSSIITPRRKLTVNDYQLLFFNIIRSFMELHRCGITHNDIKAPNILVDDDLNVKVIDYGLAEYVGLTPLKELMAYYDTTDEVKDPKGIKGFQSDSFSIGSTLIHIIVREYWKCVVEHPANIIVLRHNKATHPLNDDYFDTRIGAHGADMLKSLIDTRLPLIEVLKHPYFASLVSLHGGSSDPMISQDQYLSLYDTLSQSAYLHYPYLDKAIENIQHNQITFDQPQYDAVQQIKLLDIANNVNLPLFVDGDISFNAFINSLINSHSIIDKLNPSYLPHNLAGLYVFSSLDLYYELNLGSKKYFASSFIPKIVMNTNTKFIPVWDSIEYVLYHYQYAIDHTKDAFATVISTNFISTYRNALMQACIFFSIFGNGLVNFNEICQFVAGNVSDDIKKSYLEKIETILAEHHTVNFEANYDKILGFIARLLKNSTTELQKQFIDNHHELFVKEMMFPTDGVIQRRIHTIITSN